MNKLLEVLKTIKFKVFNGMYFRKENKVVLDKNNNYNNLEIKFSNNFIKAKKDEHIQLMSEKIKNFITVMNRDCINFNPEVLLSNIKETFFNLSMIEDNENNLFSGSVCARVLPWGEILSTTFTIDNFSTTNHELLHLSTISGLFSGFKKVNIGGTVVGVGINEGYTQLLAERYFNENKGESYLHETFFCSILENIVGKNKMEKYYFEISLSNLIKELEKYETFENISKFIKNMDFIIKNDIHQIQNPTIEEIRSYQNIIDQICEFLLSCSKSKVDIVLEENPDIDFDQYVDILLFDSFYHKTTIQFLKSKNIKEYTLKLFDEKAVLELFDYTKDQYNKNNKKMN